MFKFIKNIFTPKVEVWGLYESKNPSYFTQLANMKHIVLVTDVFDEVVYFTTITYQNGWIVSIEHDQQMSKWQFNNTFKRK